MGIGRNIRVIRESKGITQEELATKAGYKNSAIIVAIEAGSTEPAYEKIKDIANALDVSIYQVKGSNKVRKAENGEVYYSDADVIALDLFAPIIKSLTDEELDKLLDYGLLLLKATGSKPKWKVPKFQQHEKHHP